MALVAAGMELVQLAKSASYAALPPVGQQSAKGNSLESFAL